MEIWELYLLTRVGAINHLAEIIAVVGCVTGALAAVMLAMVWVDIYEDKEKEAFKQKAIKKWMRIFPPTVVICVILLALVPTEKQAYLILGGAYATNIADIEKLPPNMVKTINNYLETFQEAPSKGD